MSLEFPKVDLSGVNEAMGNLNASLEKFAEDIQKRKDNAMAMEFTRVICDLLKENGVTVEMTEIEEENHATNKFEVKYGFAFTGFDFSKHDKKVTDEKDAQIRGLKRQIEDLESIIAEGKKPDISVSENGVSVGCECGGYHLAKERIAELEKENNSLKEKISFIRTRVTEEARDFWDKDMFGSLVVTVPNKSNSENKINLNDRIKFKLTPFGAEIYYHQYDEINKKAGRTVIEPHMPKIDKDGYTENTLWAFMELYGNHIGVGKRNVIDPINIFVL